jgi:hypothetical protein
MKAIGGEPMRGSQHIAIMQPYLFPYLGYYQLVHHVETFVFLDDVTFIKQGYINRNNIRLDGNPHRFTLPVKNQSSYRLINNHYFHGGTKVIDLITTAYKKAVYYSQVMPLVAEVICHSDRNVASLTARSISIVFEYLGIKQHFLLSSEIPKDNTLKAQERVINICQVLGAQRYTNSIGGMKLYSREAFGAAGVILEFLRMRGEATYQTKDYPYLPGLSMIDVLMTCDKDDIITMLGMYDVIQ